MPSRIVLCLALCCLLAGCGGARTEPGRALAQGLAALILASKGQPRGLSLPGLSHMHDAAGGRRRVSSTDYELLPLTEYELSPGGSATHTPTSLALDPALNAGLAYAIFQLPGFPSDGSVFPESVSISRDKRCWLAVSNYTQGHWQFYSSDAAGVITLSTGQDLLSPSGNFYVALIADTGPQGGALNCSELKVTTNADLGNLCREMLVVYNSDIPESGDLADYYCSAQTGRNIDPAYIFGLPLGNPAVAAVDRATYNASIRDPIKAILNASSFKDSIKYILLMKGVPFQINDSGSGILNLSASVDSELCCLYSDNGDAGDYPKIRFVLNAPHGLDYTPTAGGFYLAGDVNFSHGAFQVSYDPTGGQPNSGDETSYPLDYLVGRLDAYTYDEAKLMVDRSLAADTSGSGWIIFDSSIGSGGQANDTMVDPVYPLTDNSGDSGAELLQAAGFNCFADVTTTRIISTSPELPGSFTNSLIGYAGWGQNHNGGSYAHQGSYILKDLGWNYLPGACFFSYESFNGSLFSCTDPSDPSIDHFGQGLICDFFHMGGTVAVGNALEPYTVGCGDERWIFDRYIHHGDRWIEAAYKGLRLISWMEVVVGDPLCRVKE